jgi:hypothetical protein
MKANKSIRLRTEPGSSKNIVVKIEQEFDTLDFLSLKITQEEAYRNFCSNYGVVAGRVIANDGFGVENAKISVFIPLSDEDAENPLINNLYPYITPLDTNNVGIRYNLLPNTGKEFQVTIKVPNGSNGQLLQPQDYYANSYATSLGTYTGPWILVSSNFGTGNFSIWKRTIIGNGPTVPVGTFPSKFEILDNDTLLEIYDKYYKYTTRTNESGDYMIFGVPIGTKTVHMDVDLSDTGAASLTVDDYINLGYPSSIFDGNKFKSSTNLDELPQIETQNLSVDVVPFWGNTEQCEIGITRLDFKLTKKIVPSAILMFEAFTNYDDARISRGCNDILGGNSDNFRAIGKMVRLGVGVEALAFGANGDDLVGIQFTNGQVLYPLPMYEDNVITDELGNTIPSNDPNKGIPTSGRYTVYVHSLTENITDTSCGPSNDCSGHANHRIPTTKYKYDLKNRKKLIYTPGNFNGASSDTGDDDVRIAIAGNQGFNGNTNRTRYPVTYQVGGEDRFGKINGFLAKGICYGSLYFMRLKCEGDEWCVKIANSFDALSSPTPPNGGVLVYNNYLGVKNTLDITEIIKIFKPNGPLDPTSAFLSIYNNGTINNATSNINLKDHFIPLTSSLGVDASGFANFPNRLDKETTQGVTELITESTGTNGGEKSKKGWYAFFFGLEKNNNALTYLKNNLGV